LTVPKVYPIVDTTLLQALGLDPVAVAAAMLEGGATILQFRHKGAYSRDVFAQAEAIDALCREANATFVVNDRADIAVLLGAGLHLGQDDLPPSMARRVHPYGKIGFSTHNEAQFLAASQDPAVDYLALGPVFATGSKENPDPVIGVAEWKRIAAHKRHPLIAIGGITFETAPEVYAAGADSIALIRALIPDSATTAGIRTRTAEWVAMASMV
jgi:thiamine-phosphate pyrophosphorylase